MMKRIMCSLIPLVSLYFVISFATAEANPLKFHEVLRFWLAAGGVSGFFAIYFAPNWEW